MKLADVRLRGCAYTICPAADVVGVSQLTALTFFKQAV